MKTIKYIIILLIISNNTFAEKFFPPIEKYKLKNGLEITFVEFGNLPVTSINFFVNTGKKNETPGFQLISSITAESVLLGNQKFSRIDQDNVLSNLGTNINVSTNDDFTKFNANFVNTDIEKAFEVFASAMLYPSFPEQEVSENIRQIIDFNKITKVDMEELTGIFSRFVVFGSSNPLGRYFYKEQLNKITNQQIKEFYQFNYTPKNTKILISGKPDKEKVKQLIDKYFGNWQAQFGETNSVSFSEPMINNKEYYFVNKTGASQVALQWNKKAPQVTSKDLVPFLIANYAFNKILFNQIRVVEGKTYSINSSFDIKDNNGLYYIKTQTKNEFLLNMMNSFDKTLSDFNKSGISNEALETSKNVLMNNLLAIETPESFVNQINPLLFPNYEKRKMFLDEISSVSAETVNKIIKKYFNPDSYKLVISGDESVVNEQLGKINNLNKLSLKSIEVDN